MLQNINPVTTQAWKKLEQHYQIMQGKHLIDLFAVDPDRFSKFSLHFEDLRRWEVPESDEVNDEANRVAKLIETIVKKYE